MSRGRRHPGDGVPDESLRGIVRGLDRQERVAERRERRERHAAAAARYDQPQATVRRDALAARAAPPPRPAGRLPGPTQADVAAAVDQWMAGTLDVDAWVARWPAPEGESRRKRDERVMTLIALVADGWAAARAAALGR